MQRSTDTEIRAKALESLNAYETYIQGKEFFKLYCLSHEIDSKKIADKDSERIRNSFANLIAVKKRDLQKAKGNKLALLAEEIDALMKLKKNFSELSTKDVKKKDPNVIIVAPFVFAVAITGAKLTVDLLTNRKPSQDTNAKIKLLSDSLKHSEGILDNPKDNIALNELTKCNAKLIKITEGDEKWRMLKSRLAMVAAIGCAIGALVFPPLIGVAAGWYDFSKKLRESSPSELKTETLSKTVDALVAETGEALKQKSEQEKKMEPSSKPPLASTTSLSIGMIQSELGVLKSLLNKVKHNIDGVRGRGESKGFSLFESKNLVLSEQKKIYSHIKVIFDQGNKLANTLSKNTETRVENELETLAEILRNARTILEKPTDCEQSIKKLSKKIEDLGNRKEKKWIPLIKELQKLVTTMKPPEKSVTQNL